MSRVFVILLLTGAALAQQAVPMELHDLPNTDGNWQEGVATIPASRAQVLHWLTDYKNWPRRFPDVEWVEVLPDDERGRHVIRFRSKIADTTITVHEAVSPSLLVFEGSMNFASTQGRIHLIDLGDGTTRVFMQSTAEAHGIARWFATKRFKRDRAYRVTHSHLTALWDLAQGFDPGVRYSRQ